jgi:DNA repair exonuclease SbcCD nuclease subunit
MRFAHLSDTHLGHRQYGIFEREQDYYELFEKTIDKIIELDVDFVINSGDLFDYSRPSTDALLSFQRGLLKLNRAGIPVYAIAGNHDSILRKDVKPPLTLFKELGLNLITKEDKVYEFEDILICGAPYEPKSRKSELEESFAELSEISKKYSKSILVLHQGIKELLPMEYEITMDDLPDNFDYYALGHLHDYHRKECGRGCLVYPGSMELMNCSDNYKEYGKGFCVVDISGDELKIDRISLEIERKLYEKVIEYSELEEELEKLKNKILMLDKKPMVDITVTGGEADSAEIYDILQDALKDDVLNLKYSYIPQGKDVNVLPEGGALNAKEKLREKVYEKYENEDISSLSVELFEKLAVNEIEDAKIISNCYFKEHYGNFDNKKTDNDISEENSKQNTGSLDDFI